MLGDEIFSHSEPFSELHVDEFCGHTLSELVQTILCQSLLVSRNGRQCGHGVCECRNPEIQTIVRSQYAITNHCIASVASTDMVFRCLHTSIVQHLKHGLLRLDF